MTTVASATVASPPPVRTPFTCGQGFVARRCQGARPLTLRRLMSLTRSWGRRVSSHRDTWDTLLAIAA
ncbi:hypothetical protein ElyMa_004882400, partial [Elysia marginata]